MDGNSGETGTATLFNLQTMEYVSKKIIPTFLSAEPLPGQDPSEPCPGGGKYKLV